MLSPVASLGGVFDVGRGRGRAVVVLTVVGLAGGSSFVGVGGIPGDVRSVTLPLADVAVAGRDVINAVALVVSGTDDVCT